MAEADIPTIIEDLEAATGEVSLTDAKIIVSGGRGVGGPEGFVPVKALAHVLGGALGASRAAVDAFHATALKLGSRDEGAPGPRPRYGPSYYGAYVRDLDGNKLQAACTARE